MGPPAEVAGARPGQTTSQPQHSGFPVPPGTSSRPGHYPPHIPPSSSALSTLTTPYPHPPPPGYSSASGLQEGSALRRQFASEEEIRAYYNRQENFLGEDMKHQIRHPYGVWNCTPVRTAASSHSFAGPGPAKQSRLAGPVSCVSGSSAASLHSSPTVTMVTGQHSSSQVSPAQPAKAGSSSSSSSSSSSAAGKTVATETSPSVPYVYQKDDLKLVINLRSTVAPLTPTETTSTTSSATNTPTTTTTTASSAASTSVSAQTVAEDIPAKPGKVKKACKDMTAQEIMDSVKGSGDLTSLSLSLSLSLPPPLCVCFSLCQSLPHHQHTFLISSLSLPFLSLPPPPPHFSLSPLSVYQPPLFSLHLLPSPPSPHIPPPPPPPPVSLPLFLVYIFSPT